MIQSVSSCQRKKLQQIGYFLGAFLHIGCQHGSLCRKGPNCLLAGHSQHDRWAYSRLALHYTETWSRRRHSKERHKLKIWTPKGRDLPSLRVYRCLDRIPFHLRLNEERKSLASYHTSRLRRALFPRFRPCTLDHTRDDHMPNCFRHLNCHWCTT